MRPLLAACSFVTMVLVWSLVIVEELQVDAFPASDSDQLADAAKVSRMGILGPLGLGPAWLHAAVDSESRSAPSPVEVEFPLRLWPKHFGSGSEGSFAETLRMRLGGVVHTTAVDFKAGQHGAPGTRATRPPKRVGRRRRPVRVFRSLDGPERKSRQLCAGPVGRVPVDSVAADAPQLGRPRGR